MAPRRLLLDFEKPLVDLEEQIEQIRQLARDSEVDVSQQLLQLETLATRRREEIFSSLTPAQKIQVARHPQRPSCLDYIQLLSDDWIELHGDRSGSDDQALVGGLGRLDGRAVLFIGHQKGRDTKENVARNFGMASPGGYRKALRLMKLAEKFNRPIVTLIDTPGAFPGLEAEERGQGEAIARNLIEMCQLRVPVICIVIGEGASGGALGIGIGDRVLMLENTWYSVISPESCSSILWRNWDHKMEAAEALKLTGTDMQKLGLVDGIIPEPLGGAHADRDAMFAQVKKEIKKHLNKLVPMDADKRIDQRIRKFASMGVVNS